MKGRQQDEVGETEATVDQQEELRPSGAKAWNNLWVYKLVPWLNWDEWDRVRVSLFSSSPELVAFALDRIAAWNSRGCLPIAIEATASLFGAQLGDPFFRKEKPPEAFYSEGTLVSLYGMSIQRLVNGTIEKTRKRDKSMADAAEAINIPRMLIDIRHEVSHRELPSLPVLREGSIEAIEWLKEYYWQPQIVRLQCQRGISFQAGKEVGISFHFKAREVAEAKVYSAFWLMKEHNLASCSKVISEDDQRVKRSFAMTVKFLGMLYCSYPLEVVSILLELFLKDSYTNSEIPGDIQRDPGMYRTCWKYLTEELSKKRPQLLITLLNVVIDMIEAQDANKHETGKLVQQMMVSAYGGKAYPIELLYTLSAEVVSMLKQLKLSTQKICFVETEVPTMKQIPRAMLVALARRFIRVAACADKQFANTTLEVVRLLKDEKLANKLTKLTLLAWDNAEVDPILGTSAEPKEDIELASRKLNAIRNISRKKTGRSRWRVAKSWSPCPIGMLPPDADFSHNYFPILDHSAAELWSNRKKEASHDEDDPSSESKGKRSRAETADDMMVGNGGHKNGKVAGRGSEGVDRTGGGAGLLMIGGSWKRVGQEDIRTISSSIRLLV